MILPFSSYPLPFHFLLYKYSPANSNLLLIYDFPFLFKPYKNSPSNIILPFLSNSFPFPFFTPFKYSPSNSNLPSSYSFPFRFLFPFKYSPSNIISPMQSYSFTLPVLLINSYIILQFSSYPLPFHFLLYIYSPSYLNCF